MSLSQVKFGAGMKRVYKVAMGPCRVLYCFDTGFL